MSRVVFRWRISGRSGDGPPVALAHSTDRDRAERTAAALAGADHLDGQQRAARAIRSAVLLVWWEAIPPTTTPHRDPAPLAT